VAASVKHPRIAANVARVWQLKKSCPNAAQVFMPPLPLHNHIHNSMMSDPAQDCYTHYRQLHCSAATQMLLLLKNHPASTS
jgi:hypothetical protein